MCKRIAAISPGDVRSIWFVKNAETIAAAAARQNNMGVTFTLLFSLLQHEYIIGVKTILCIVVNRP